MVLCEDLVFVVPIKALSKGLPGKRRFASIKLWLTSCLTIATVIIEICLAWSDVSCTVSSVATCTHCCMLWQDNPRDQA